MRLWLKDLRERRGYTQTYTAKLSCISTQFYSYIENGDRSPSVAVAKRIGKVLVFDWTMFYETE